MNAQDEIFGEYQDASGEAYYCPVNEVADARFVNDDELGNCVEASTVGRYSGNINLAERNSS